MGGIEPCTYRLREVDVKAEHYERQVQRLEAEIAAWERKYEVRRAPSIHSQHRICASSDTRPPYFLGIGDQVQEIPSGPRCTRQ